MGKREELIRFRKLLGKTQVEMAKHWGITLSFYKQIECGVKNPSIDKVKEFRNVFPSADTGKIFLS